MYTYIIFYVHSCTCVCTCTYRNLWPLIPSCQCLCPFPENFVIFLSFSSQATQNTYPQRYMYMYSVIHTDINVLVTLFCTSCYSIMQYILKLPPDGNLELLKGSVSRRSGISMSQVCESLSLSLSLSPWLIYFDPTVACVWSVPWKISDNALQQSSTNQRHWRKWHNHCVSTLQYM